MGITRVYYDDDDWEFEEEVIEEEADEDEEVYSLRDRLQTIVCFQTFKF